MLLVNRLGLYLRVCDVLAVLETKGIGFRALNSPMDTTTPAGRAFLQIQAAFAEMERNLIRQRVKEGLTPPAHAVVTGAARE